MSTNWTPQALPTFDIEDTVAWIARCLSSSTSEAAIAYELHRAGYDPTWIVTAISAGRDRLS